MAKDRLTIIDSHTGRSCEVRVFYETYPGYGAAIRAGVLGQINTSKDDFGFLSCNPAAGNTAACRGAITFVDGDGGILRYRGDAPSKGSPSAQQRHPLATDDES